VGEVVDRPRVVEQWKRRLQLHEFREFMRRDENCLAVAAALSRRITLELMDGGDKERLVFGDPRFWLSLRRRDDVVLLFCVFFTEHTLYAKRDMDAR
jgi:hypothetical protein